MHLRGETHQQVTRRGWCVATVTPVTHRQRGHSFPPGERLHLKGPRDHLDQEQTIIILLESYQNNKQNRNHNQHRTWLARHLHPRPTSCFTFWRSSCPQHRCSSNVKSTFLLLPALSFAVHLPPTCACAADFWINVALFILGWIPGVIHAWWIISKYPDHTPPPAVGHHDPHHTQPNSQYQPVPNYGSVPPYK
ncbi:hypothetical protein PTTG_12442 [Puccinia triticina 1-1 BBBD Race 1]|uniref:Stress response RCI peptide n=2 Tax=Puccinia triticina TaxID=208348 RepID=A0A180GAF4_PUCT1|nr:uncharacterized protein PtA15_13A342 [Puccinia triticina]OAV89685.1 hypothetical protein PTTG_12442 [Puccinia triticina 1-1 BBBD Race 1]WAQ90942.1 hypothetical protein PtA15_13A342 [Puccinia triticina]WAR61128.1 hypothetical protein PtB15_13B380 [Puccinia triticina]